jgi:hypothetical protein
LPGAFALLNALAAAAQGLADQGIIQQPPQNPRVIN